MSKNRIRLTESDLHRIVKESVNKVLNEMDYSSIPLGDFIERNKWWKTQLDNDFPNHNVKDSKNWQYEYDRLFSDKLRQDKRLEKQNVKMRKIEAERLRDIEENKDIIDSLESCLKSYYNDGNRSENLLRSLKNLEDDLLFLTQNYKWFDDLDARYYKALDDLEYRSKKHLLKPDKRY